MRMCQERVPQIQRRLGRRRGLILHTVHPKFRVASKFPSLVEISRDKQISAHLFAEPAGEGQDGFRSFLGPVDQSHVSRLFVVDNSCHVTILVMGLAVVNKDYVRITEEKEAGINR